MDIEALTAAQADPQLPFECDDCGTRYRFRLGAAYCCDAVCGRGID